MQLTASNLAAVASMMAKRGINVICAGNECFTDCRTIILPAMPERISEPLLRLIRFYLDHEAGHIIGESDTKCMDAIGKKCGKAGQSILNALEDVRTDALMGEQWAGCKVNLRLGLDELMEHMEAESLTRKDDELWQLIRGTYLVGRGVELPDWVGEKMAKVINYFRPLIASIPQFVKNGSITKTSQLVDLAENIYDAANLELQGEQQQEQQQDSDGSDGENPPPDTPDLGGSAGTKQPEQPEQPEQPDQPDQPEQPGDGGDSEGDGDSRSSETSDGDSEEKPQEQTPGDGDAGDGEGIEQEQEPPRDPLNEGPAPESIAQLAAGATGDGLAEARKDPANQFSSDASQLPGAEKEEAWGECDPDEVAGRFWNKAMGVAGPIRQRLSQLLQSENKKWWRGGQTMGWPDPRSMAMLAAGLSNEVMRRRFKKIAPNTACYLLVDASSSMRGDERLFNAMLAALVFSTTLDICGHANKVGIFRWRHLVVLGEIKRQLKAAGSTENAIDVLHAGNPSGLGAKLNALWVASSHGHRGGVTISVIKGWQQNARTVLPKFSAASRAASGSTPMGEAIRMAARDLMARREKRKVLMVFTDGCPNDKPLAITTIEECEKAGIEIVLIGIGCDYVEKLHHKTALVINIEDLASTTMKELASALKVGHSYQPQLK